MDEINRLKELLTSRLAAEPRKRRVSRRELEDDIEEMLLMAYAIGASDAGFDLDVPGYFDTDRRKDAVEAPIAGKTWRERLSEIENEQNRPPEGIGGSEDDVPYRDTDDEKQRWAWNEEPVTPEGGLFIDEATIADIMRIADTESHRLYNSGAFDVAKANGAKSKQWVCTFHNSRDTHIYLHGITVGIDDEFYTENGSAQFPGQFGVPEEDCNCLCYLKYSK